MFTRKIIGNVFLGFLLILQLHVISPTVVGQGTAFAYQGKLTDSGTLANGQFDFRFKLFDTETVGTGTQQGGDITALNATVTNGVFTVQLDFGACPTCFNGATRFLEIAVKPASSATFTTLGPRQPISATPYSIKSKNATSADGLTVACVSCITSSQIQSIQGSQVAGNIAGGQINGAIPVASVPSGSTNYVQNRTTQQAATDFNISGTGTANVLNATNQYRLGGYQILTALGFSNFFAGINAGINTTTGINNTFVGNDTGTSNRTGSNNTFIGYFANFNGGSASGNDNTLLGANARAIFFQNNATAIGANALVAQSNSLVLGSINGQNEATADTDVGIGTSIPAARFHVVRNTNDIAVPIVMLESRGSQIPLSFRSDNTEVARLRADSSGNLVLATLHGTGKNLHFRAGDDSTTDMFIESASGNVGIGTTAPTSKLMIAGSGSFSVDGAARFDLVNTTASVGYFQHVFDDGRWQLGTSNLTRILVEANGNVGIGTGAVDKLQVAGDIRVGTGTTGCVKDANGSVIAGVCSSDARLKSAITPFPNLLDKVVQLQPVHFFWHRDAFPERHFGSAQSYGLIAQEAEKVLPELVSEDDKGYKVVNYSKLPLFAIQAIKELKAENDTLKQRLNEQQQEMAAIKKLLCFSQPQANLCTAK